MATKYTEKQVGQAYEKGYMTGIKEMGSRFADMNGEELNSLGCFDDKETCPKDPESFLHGLNVAGEWLFDMARGLKGDCDVVNLSPLQKLLKEWKSEPRRKAAKRKKAA